MSGTPVGYWTTDAPLTPEQMEEDLAPLKSITIPDGCHLNSAELYVNGRLWKWERMWVEYGNVRREPTDV